MARVGINTGSTANDGTGDSLRAAGGIINSNFTEIYSQLGDGTNLSATWEKTSAGINSTANVGIGTTNPQFQLEVGYAGVADTSLFVHGNARVTGILTVGASSIVIDGSRMKFLLELEFPLMVPLALLVPHKFMLEELFSLVVLVVLLIVSG